MFFPGKKRVSFNVSRAEANVAEKCFNLDMFVLFVTEQLPIINE